MAQLDPKIVEVLRKYGFGQDAAWNCHGTWVVYHKALEQIAAKAGIKYAEPKILVAEKEAAAILVTGSLGDASEWSIGEAVVGLNYKVKNNQPGYPFAMAEKRAKDRVILKLIGLHGLAYSEEEADEFKDSAPRAAPPANSNPPSTNAAKPANDKAATEAEWVKNRKVGPLLDEQDANTLLSTLKLGIRNSDDLDDMKKFIALHDNAITNLPHRHYVELKWAAVEAQERFKKVAA